ncbi:hypothetical protein [Pedobacter roseus]|uniref:Uncharacterized protein n=1 Tax=Pedobacter roseus TaxID=336820 RepID=A0A7G9QCH7_9SPHI|nr:hypothetical protein [Pedobacter roseus]QNN41052.1 hypothetical protein H9L23_18280 [Pedobacter roseus]
MVPEIKISVCDNPFFDLVKAVYQYYPIGTRDVNEAFPGYGKLTTIVKDKVERLISNTLPAAPSKLDSDIRNSFNNLAVLISYHHQFPNYAIDIRLPKIEYVEVGLNYKLSLRISLLTNYYTIFFEEVILHKNLKAGFNQTPSMSFAVSSSIGHIADAENMVQILKTIVETNFPDHKFVNHVLLFSRKIQGGYPHGADGNPFNKEYSLYNFLFDNEYQVSEDFNVVY